MAEAAGEGIQRRALEERIHPRARSRLTVREMESALFIEAQLPCSFHALFTTRVGGESNGSFSSLNLDLRSGDDYHAVDRNRSRVARALDELMIASDIGANCLHRLVSPAQVHGLRVVGTAEYVKGPIESPCDGLILHPEIDRGLAALLLYADCVPIVLAGEVDMAVVHAGWRGLLGGVVQQAGRAMTGPPGTAVIGPSIGSCCFTVGEDVARAFTDRFGSEVVVNVDSVSVIDNSASAVNTLNPVGGCRRVDLWAAAALALMELGIGEDRIVNPRLCTSCNNDFFFSYRREGPVTGRHGCVGWAA